VGRVTITRRSGSGGGTPGADGKSAYQLWLEAGNSGDLAAFFESLRGPQGNPGPPGSGGGGLGMREMQVVGARPLMGYDGTSPGGWKVGSTNADPAEAGNTWLRIPLPPGVAGVPAVARFINWGIQGSLGGSSFDGSNVNAPPDPILVGNAIKMKAQYLAGNQNNAPSFRVYWEDGSEFGRIESRGERITKPFRLGDPGDDFLIWRSYYQNALQTPVNGLLVAGPVPGAGNGNYANDSTSHSLGEADKRFTNGNALPGGIGYASGFWPFGIYALEPPSGLAYLPTVLVGDSRIAGMPCWVHMALGNDGGVSRVPHISLARATEMGSQFLSRAYGFLRWGMLHGVRAAILTYGINDLSSQTQVPLSTIQNMRNDICAMLSQAGVTTIIETSISPATTRIDGAQPWTPDNQMHGVWTSTPQTGVGHPRSPSEPTRQAFNTYMRNNSDPTTHIFDETGGVTRYFYDECAVVETTNSSGLKVWNTGVGGAQMTDDGLHPNAVGDTALKTNAVSLMVPLLVRV
jgi:hypothetical protein